jgi:hypothetical protein
VRAVIEGKWSLEDPRVWEFFEVSSKLFNYLQPGYAAPAEFVAETPTDFCAAMWATATRAFGA